jgi:mannose-6-phosphate isomerase-like protein (cupin superfamily)
VNGAFCLEEVYVALDGGGGAVTLPVGPDFWERIEETPAATGALVSAGESASDWSVWEMHPKGDEIIYLLSGDVEILLEGAGSVRLSPGQTTIVPKGVWHTARVPTPSKLLFITFGEGTQHKPAEAA